MREIKIVKEGHKKILFDCPSCGGTGKAVYYDGIALKKIVGLDKTENRKIEDGCVELQCSDCYVILRIPLD